MSPVFVVAKRATLPGHVCTPPPPPLCRNCGKHGHVSDDCRIQSVAVTVANELSLSRPVSTVSHIHNQAGASPITHYGTSPVSSSSVAGQLHVVPGFIADKPVSVLRDSGATVVGVHNDYVSDSDLTGRTIPCYQFSGKVEDMPVARIHIDTPFLSGFVSCWLFSWSRSYSWQCPRGIVTLS